jgi:hypothetical protein
MTLPEMTHDTLVVIGSAVGGYLGQHMSIRRIRAVVAAGVKDLREALDVVRARVDALERAIRPEERPNG